jgi:hypothetical protein
MRGGIFMSKWTHETYYEYYMNREWESENSTSYCIPQIRAPCVCCVFSRRVKKKVNIYMSPELTHLTWYQ